MKFWLFLFFNLFWYSILWSMFLHVFLGHLSLLLLPAPLALPSKSRRKLAFSYIYYVVLYVSWIVPIKYILKSSNAFIFFKFSVLCRFCLISFKSHQIKSNLSKKYNNYYKLGVVAAEADIIGEILEIWWRKK